jgi:replicative DNA helicase
MKQEKNNTPTESEGRILPRNIESERIVLGTIMSDNCFCEVQDMLTETCFYDDFHRDVFRAIKKIYERGDRTEGIAVLNDLQKQGLLQALPYTAILSSYSPQYDQYVKELIEKEKRRTFFEIGQYLTANAFSEAEEVTDVMENARKKIDAMLGNTSDSIFLIKDAIVNVFNQMDINSRREAAEISGTKTGLKEFDRKAGGLQKSDLNIIAAETSQGKTSLALTVTRNAALNGTKIAFYSLEMRKEQLAARLMAMESGVPSNQILYARLQPYQFEKIDKTVRAIYNSQIFFDERSTSNIDVIISSIRSLALKHGIEGAVVDYLQILSVNTKEANREQQMGDVARRLKNLAKELDIWIIALSQLSRDAHSSVPSIDRLRGSGQIAEAADNVLLIYRPECCGKQYPSPFHNEPTAGTAMIDVAKGRNIGLLKFICAFDEQTTCFTNLDERKTPLPKKKTDDEQLPF